MRHRVPTSGTVLQAVMAGLMAIAVLAAVLAVSCVSTPATCAVGAVASTGSCVIGVHAQAATVSSSVGTEAFRVPQVQAASLKSAAVPGALGAFRGSRPLVPIEPPRSADPLHERLIV